jgi:hypothetical protein
LKHSTSTLVILITYYHNISGHKGKQVSVHELTTPYTQFSTLSDASLNPCYNSFLQYRQFQCIKYCTSGKEAFDRMQYNFGYSLYIFQPIFNIIYIQCTIISSWPQDLFCPSCKYLYLDGFTISLCLSIFLLVISQCYHL